MKFTKTALPEVVLIEPKVFDDPRGAFFESYHARRFFEQGIRETFVQDNHVISGRGVLRGLHFQKPPAAQAKLLRVVRGKIFDVAVDIRKGSPTFGRWVSAELSAANRKMLYVPAGFAHGYLSLDDGTEVLYKVSSFYAPETEGGILWNDPSIGIPWPKIDGGYHLSEKDKKLPLLNDL
ncbi:MAG: dTDP-4-dehydrorhamnose 3,5-epimerase [Candidatus Omnitrophota bacterium]